ncbi:deoxyguanosinetriphosphate triphosphohydrolase [Pseudahrensia aquimaris]|uniref:Deoxyguanosinetriphosphate triphosphohydrolase-like protein n=1 Tax=Pseudahrensia aquimaris TaxID=744461 RepID=A0ABW3FP17_9HYPH
MLDPVLTDLRRTAGGRALAPYAAQADLSRGRLIDEPASATRTDFQRDRDRIIHSDAFRRLKHKTQVFIQADGDHFRTRLTHTIEVAQIARALARALKADEDLAEALALVHDFGHTPFGHAGERVLENKLKTFGGFEHNAQSLRIVTQLERGYAGFDGLNLTWETLEGLVKHNGPLTDADGDGLDGPVPTAIEAYNTKSDLWLWSWPSVEAQCAAIADDIAYNSHDIDDALRAGLFMLDDVAEVPLCAAILESVRAQHPDLEPSRMRHELVRRQITLMIEDVLRESLGRITQSGVDDADAVRRLDYPLVSFSSGMAQQEQELKAFLFARMYRAPLVMDHVEKAQSVVSDLFDRYLEDPSAMPQTPEWQMIGLDDAAQANLVADYIAGMTDRYALRAHRKLFPESPVAQALLD